MADVKKIATRESYGNALKALGGEVTDLVVLDEDLTVLRTLVGGRTVFERT